MPGYGHDRNGVNMTNLRATAERSYRSVGGFRPPFDWEKESKDDEATGTTLRGTSAIVRAQSEQVQAYGADTVKASENRTEMALKSKVNKLATLKDMLEDTVAHTDMELGKMHENKLRVERHLARQKSALELNQKRLVVRDGRPTRELTHDEVQSKLVAQQKVLMGSIDKLSNCVASNEHDFQRLMGNRDTLLADLQDKVDALSVDEAALNATIDGAAPLDGQLQKKVTCYPHNWVQSSEAEMKQARIRAADATRLRHAIAGCIDEAKAHEKDMEARLQHALGSKINSTDGLKSELVGEHRSVMAELNAAQQRQAELEQALEEKQAPLALGRTRYQMRHQRPQRELVHDEVEEALTSELNDLKFVCASIEKKLAAVKKEIARLMAHAATLEANIQDKHDALGVDSAVLHLDDRASVASSKFAPSSVGSRRSATTAKIDALEQELYAARESRRAMEQELELVKTMKKK